MGKKKRDMWDGEKEKGPMWGRRKVWAYIGEEGEYVGMKKKNKRVYGAKKTKTTRIHRQIGQMVCV